MDLYNKGAFKAKIYLGIEHFGEREREALAQKGWVYTDGPRPFEVEGKCGLS